MVKRTIIDLIDQIKNPFLSDIDTNSIGLGLEPLAVGVLSDLLSPGYGQYELRYAFVSIFPGGWYTQTGFGPRDTWEDKFRHCLSACEPYLPPLLVIDPLAVSGIEPHASKLKAEPEEMVCMWAASSINVVVPGGKAQPHFKMFGLYRDTTVRIDEWRQVH